MTTITVNSEVAILRPQSAVKIVSISNPEPASWVRQKMMSFNKAVRAGALRSAWDDYESEADAFAGRKSPNAPTASETQEEFERFKRERAETARRQEAKIEEIKRKQIEKAEQERREREEAALAQAEQIEGWGSF
jgi:hypothetical protein